MNHDRAYALLVFALCVLFVSFWVAQSQQLIGERGVAVVPVLLPESGAENDNSEWSPEAEVADIMENRRNKARYIANISPRLARVIKERPVYMLICVVLVQAERDPEISRQERDDVLRLAKQDTDAALVKLRETLSAASARKMKRVGFNLQNDGRRAWDDGIPSMRTFFLDFPLARKLKKEKELVTATIEGYRYGNKNWWQPDITKEQYINWR